MKELIREVLGISDSERDIEILLSENAKLRERIDRLRKERSEAEERVSHWIGVAAELRDQREVAATERDTIRAENEKLRKENKELGVVCDRYSQFIRIMSNKEEPKTEGATS